MSDQVVLIAPRCRRGSRAGPASPPTPSRQQPVQAAGTATCGRCPETRAGTAPAGRRRLPAARIPAPERPGGLAQRPGMSASAGGRMADARRRVGDHRDVCGPDPAAPARDSRAHRHPLPRLPGGVPGPPRPGTPAGVPFLTAVGIHDHRLARHLPGGSDSREHVCWRAALTPAATTSGTPAATANASASGCPARVRSPAML